MIGFTMQMSQIERSCYSLTLLPTKQHSLALFGFLLLKIFPILRKDSKEFAFLDFEKRYQLNSILNSLRAAVQQGLKRILILGKTEELPLLASPIWLGFWRKYYSNCHI